MKKLIISIRILCSFKAPLFEHGSLVGLADVCAEKKKKKIFKFDLKIVQSKHSHFLIVIVQ